MKKYTLEISKILILLAIVVLGVGAVSAWTGPSVAPPNGNVAAPINVSSVEQIKSGKLGVGGLASFGQGLFSTSSSPYLLSAKLLLGINGPVGATEYCNELGALCVSAAEIGGAKKLPIVINTQCGVSNESGVTSCTPPVCPTGFTDLNANTGMYLVSYDTITSSSVKTWNNQRFCVKWTVAP